MLLARSLLSDTQAKIFFCALISVVYFYSDTFLPSSEGKRNISGETLLVLEKGILSSQQHGCLRRSVLVVHLVHQNCCLSSVAFVDKNYCWHFIRYHAVIFTLAFRV
jgi:hypothetical protein